MKNDNQKMLIIIIGGLLLITSITAFVMGANSSKESKETKPKGKEPIVTSILKREIAKLNDSDTFFAVQEAINNFYVDFFNNKEDAILLLDKSFVSKNKIDINNINNFIKETNENVNFQAQDIYYNPDSNMTYYFINGYTISSNIEGKELKYTPNLYYLLKVDMENNYSIIPLLDVENFEEYVNKYYLDRIYIDNTTNFKVEKINEVNKMVNYINNFKNLMNLDVNKAYNMLNDSTKSKYANLKEFENSRVIIAEKLFTKFASINIQRENDIINYNLTGNNQDTIIITEMYPNDYKIDFNFLDLSE